MKTPNPEQAMHIPKHHTHTKESLTSKKMSDGAISQPKPEAMV